MIPRLGTLRGAALAVVVLTAGSAIADPQAIRYYEDAVSRFNSGDSKGALIQLKNSLQRDPTQLPARVLVAQIQLDLGNPLQAEEELTMADKLGADRALIALPLARARNRLGRYDEVIEDLRPTEYPVAMRADLWAELGKARLGNKDRVGAEIAFAEALKLVPHHEEAMVSQARGLVQQRRYGDARPLAAEILSRYPENAEAWMLMGSIYHARGEFDSAVAHHHKASQLDPDNEKAVLAEALSLMDGGKFEQAAELLQKMLKTYPLSLEAHYFASKALRQLGRTDEAAKALRQASDMVNVVTPADLGDNSSLLLLAAIVKTESGEYEGAHAFLTGYLKHEPGDLSANKRLARLLMKIDRPADASRLLTRLKVSNPDDLELLVLLGDANSSLHDYIAAERYYRFALERVVDRPALVGRLGLSQLRQGRADAAINTFRSLADQGHDANLGVSVFLGILYLNNGRLEEAREVADRIVAAQPDNLVALNLQAAIAITQGDRERGRRMLQTVLARDPAFPPARFNLVKLDILEGNYQAAAEVLEQLLRANPDDQTALHEAARLATAQNDRTLAIARLVHLRKLNPRAVRPILELVNLYLTTDQIGEALKVALALEREVPNNLLVKKGLAQVQLARDQTAVAQSLLNDAAQLAGRNADHLAGVARLQVRAGALDAAEANLRKALEEQPGSTVARMELARLLARSQRYPHAVTEAAAVLEREPDNLAAITLLGDLRMAQGRPGEAITLYRRAQGLSDRPQLMTRLHRALLRAGRDDQALAELRAWHAAHPDTPMVMRALADHLARKGDSGAALKLYLRLVELVPDSALAHNNLANMLLTVDVERALAAASRAHELARENAAVLDTLGWVLVQLGDLDKGLAHLREAVARSSRSPTIRYHLAVALEEYGNRTEARRELQRALAMKARFPEREQAVLRLQRLSSQQG